MWNSLNKIRNSYGIYFLFIVLSLLIFYPTRNGGMVTDFTGWMLRYRAGGFTDIATCFGFPSLHQAFHLLNYSFYKIVGMDPFAWYFLYAILHGINTGLLFRLTDIWRKRWRQHSSIIYPLAAAFLFLISPYQVEVVVWKVCIHYLLSTAYTLGALLVLIRYLERKKKAYLLLHHALVITGMFTLEIGLAAPFIFLVFIIADYYHVKEQVSPLQRTLKYVFLPQLVFLIIYFLLNKLILGDWVGHYGAEKHLIFSPLILVSHGWQYFAKYLGNLHFLPLDSKTFLYAYLARPLVSYSLLIVAVSCLISGVLYYRKLSPNVKIGGVSLLMFFMALFPIINLYFLHTMPYENDRYGYYASPYFYLFVVNFIFNVPRAFRYAFLFWYIVWQGFLLGSMIKDANSTSHMTAGLLENFPCEKVEGKSVFLLGLPDNYRGHPMFRDFSGRAEAFHESLDLFYDRTVCSRAEIYDIMQYNMTNDDSALNAYYETPDRIKVFFAQDGTWFWRNSIGATSYETEEYRVELKGWYYLLHLNKEQDNAIFLYPDGDRWVEVEHRFYKDHH